MPDTPLCLRLDDVADASTEQVGGKARNLGAMLKAQLPVPGGFVVTTTAYRALAAAANVPLSAGALGDGDVVERARERLRTTAWPASVSAEILRQFDACTHDGTLLGRCAVRSSSSCEDHALASFAGQHETFYNITREGLLEAIRSCCASLWSASAVSYREALTSSAVSVGEATNAGATFDVRSLQGKAPINEPAMAVVVQTMIACDVSGVTFTLDPATGDVARIVTDATWGLGAALVDGRVSPDHFVVERQSGTIIERRVGNKALMIRPTGEECGALTPVPMSQRSEATLTDQMLGEITGYALQCETHFGAPQDIEWGIYQQQVFIFQSRPVTARGGTTTPEAVTSGESIESARPTALDSHDTRKLLLFKPAAENFAEPLTPLSADILGRMARCLGGEVVDGWLYLDMRVLHHLIPLRLNEAELAEVAYLAKPPPLRVAWKRLPGLLAVALLGALAGGIVALRTRNLDDDVFEVFRTKLEAVRNDETLGPRESAQALYLGHPFFEPIGNMPLIANVSAARYFFSLALVRKLLARWAPELGPNAGATLCTGTPGMRSVQMSRDIEALGQLALNNDHVKTMLINSAHVDASTVASLRASGNAATFCTAFEAFLDTHGHRTTRELELASARWHEAPHTVLAMVRNQVVANTEKDSARPDGPNHPQRREALAQRLRDALNRRPLERALGVRARVLNALIATTGYYVKLRENTRYYHIMVLDVVREKVLRQATALLERGMLTHRDDAFFLTAWELDELAASRTADEVSPPDIHKIIERRRAKHRHNTR
ncbi:MAG: hypothetical protein ACI9W2_003717, partial [Gammaproteobacteria bacterium]